MISEIILGTIIPAFLFCQIPFVANCIQSFKSNLNIVSTTYLTILNNIQNENKNNLCIQLVAPVYAIYKLITNAYHSSISYIEYKNNKNVIFFENHYCIQYTLRNKNYYILLDKKEVSNNQIYKVLGFDTSTDESDQNDSEDVSSSEQYDTTCDENNTSCDEDEHEELEEDEHKELEEENEENNEKENEENEEENEEEENEEENEEEENEEEEVLKEPLLDITDYFFSYYGPCKNFHNSVITPRLLGFDKIVIYYLDGVNFEECEVTFVDDEVIQI